MPSAPDRLRALLALPDPVVAPGAADPLTALLAREAGFPAIHVTGGGIARGLGQPDLGQFGLAELAGRVGAIAEACDLPMIVDADSGFGGPIAMARTVRLLARAGAAAFHIEDRELPRRVLDPKANLLDPVAMSGRIRAALAAREAGGPLLIARTDAVPLLGLDAAIDRANRYADAGADLVYVEFARDRAAIEAVARRISAPKLVAVTRGETAALTTDELGAMGFRIVIFPADAQLAAIAAMRAVLAHIATHGMAEGFSPTITMAERDAIVGAPGARAFEERFLK